MEIGADKIFRVRLFGHCIFCLRKTARSKDVLCKLAISSAGSPVEIEKLELVPTADMDYLALNGNLLTTFNRLWPHVQSNSRCLEGDNGPLSFVQFPCSKVNKSTTFNRLPKMCQFCAERLEAVDRIWRELAEQISKLRGTITKSKCGGEYSWRATQFENTLKRSDLDAGAIREVLEFLEIVKSPQEDEDDSNSNELAKELQKTEISSKDYASSGIDVSPNNTGNESTIYSSIPVLNPPQNSGALTQPRKLSRQLSVEILTPQTPTPVCQQSSETYTSLDNEPSFDQDEADEEADDESDPEYTQLEPGGFSSDTTWESEEEANLTSNSVTVESDESETISNHNAKRTVPETKSVHDAPSPEIAQENEKVATKCVIDNKIGLNLNDSPLVECSQCEGGYQSWEELVAHMSYHSDTGLPCDICKDGVKYFMHNLLREHYSTVHGIGEQFPCQQCAVVCFSPQSLTTHLTTKHRNYNNAPPAQLRN